jgi:hypothetical protein
MPSDALLYYHKPKVTGSGMLRPERTRCGLRARPLPSNDPRMLVCVLGKDAPGEYDIKVPDSIPGFVAFEPASVFTALAM